MLDNASDSYFNENFGVDKSQINSLLLYAKQLNIPYNFTTLKNSPSICEVQIYLSSSCNKYELSASFLCEASQGKEFKPDFQRVEIMFDFTGEQRIRFYTMETSIKVILKFIEWVGKK